MLMKSVIINLKYLIFRSMSAAEGGGMEEGEEGRREGGRLAWKNGSGGRASGEGRGGAGRGGRDDGS